jgi:hypothetical protein
MTVVEWVEIISASSMPCAVIGLFINRHHQKTDTLKDGAVIRTKYGAGIGARAIQFVAVAMFFPVIIILALEGKIEGQTTAALLGGAVGYLLSGISNYDLTRMVEKLVNAVTPATARDSAEMDTELDSDR